MPEREAHSKLQQLDLRSEHGVQLEFDTNRNVQYLHIDGYTATRVNGSPRTTVIRNGHEFEVTDVVDVRKVAGYIAGIMIAMRLLTGQPPYTAAELRQLEQDAAEKLRDL